MIDVNVQIKDERNGEELNLYPTSKGYNIIVSENPLITLDEWIESQLRLNVKFNSAITKMDTVENNAEENQNAYSSFRINNKLIDSTLKEDTIIFEFGDLLTTEIEDKTIKVNAVKQDAQADESNPGLMSPEQVAKLNGIEDNANKYIHPNSGVSPDTYLRVNVDKKGHVTSGSNDQLSISEGGTGARSLVDAKRNLEIPELTLNTLSETATAPVSSRELYRVFETKANKEHGNHVPDSEIPNNQRFLREGNTWSEIWKGTEDNAGILKLTDDRESLEEYTAVTPKMVRKTLDDAKKYVRDQINELINGAEDSYDTLKELQDYIKEHGDFMQALSDLVATKVTKIEGKGLSTNDFDDVQVQKLRKAYEWVSQYDDTENPEYNAIIKLQKNGHDLEINNRVVNIPVPTKVSDIENDTGYITKHPDIATNTNTNTESTLSMGGSFNIIDSLVRDSNNHVTSYNIKTLTLPSSSTVSNQLEVRVDDDTYLLFDGSLRKVINFIPGDNIKIESTERGIKFTPTYQTADILHDGLMPRDMYSKLNGIANNANNYSLPTAGIDSLGGVKTTSTVTDTNYYTPSPIVAGVPYYKKSSVDVLTSDPVNPPIGYMWIKE